MADDWVEQLNRGCPPKDLILTEDLIKNLGVSSRFSARILKALQTKGVDTWGALERIADRAKLIEYITDEVSADAIWSYLRDFKAKKPLTKEWLEDMGVDPNYSGEVLHALQKNRLSTWGALSGIEDKPKLIEYAKDEVSAGAIWSYLQSFKVQGPLDQSAKRLRLVEDDEQVGVPAFVNQCLLRMTDVDFNNHVVEFNIPLWGLPGNQNFLLMRENSSKMVLDIVETFINTRRTIILAGSKGIGKSCEGLHMLKLFMDRGKIILYENGVRRMMIVPRISFQDQVVELNRHIHKFTPETITQPGVYAFSRDGIDLFWDLCLQPTYVCVVDIGDMHEGGIDVSAKKIIISSPNSDKLKRTGEVQLPYIKYLDPWTWEQLLELNQRLPRLDDQSVRRAASSSDAPDLPIMVQKSDEELRMLVRMFGCIPREIFPDRPIQIAESKIIKAIREVPFTRWKEVLTESDFSKIPRLVPGILVHITENKELPGQCHVRFASKFIAEQVIRSFFKSLRNELFALANSIKGNSRLTAQLREELLQQRMHEVMETEPELRLTSLHHDGGIGEDVVIRVPKLTTIEFQSNNLADITDVKENEYYVSLSSNFPSVESFFLAKRRLLGIDEEGMCIVGLQATIASRHAVKRHGLKKIQDFCMKILGMVLPLVLIFVTTPNGIQTWQKMGSKILAFDKKVRQYRCTSIDMTQILQVFPSESAVADEDAFEELPENEEEEE